MHKKRGQVSTFIIIGLIILIVVALVIYIISQLTKEEADSLRFQIGMSKPIGRGGRQYLPLMTPPQKPKRKIGFLREGDK